MGLTYKVLDVANTLLEVLEKSGLSPEDQVTASDTAAAVIRAAPYGVMVKASLCAEQSSEAASQNHSKERRGQTE